MTKANTTSTKKSVSAAKLAANQANAQKSTGPKTPEGKLRSSRNGIKHGLYAIDIVLPDDEAECVQAFDAFRDEFIRGIQPANIIERQLVESIAIAYWRLRRAYRHEARCTHDVRTQVSTDFTRNIPRQLGFAHGTDLPVHLPYAPDLDKILRYESTQNRTIQHSLRRLIQLRTTASDLFAPSDDDSANSPPLAASRVPLPDPRLPTPALPSPRLPIADPPSATSNPPTPDAPDLDPASPNPDSEISDFQSHIRELRTLLSDPSLSASCEPNPEYRAPNPELSDRGLAETSDDVSASPNPKPVPRTSQAAQPQHPTPTSSSPAPTRRTIRFCPRPESRPESPEPRQGVNHDSLRSQVSHSGLSAAPPGRR